MEALELSISMYKTQLDQVKLALQSCADDENRIELDDLVASLNELIAISEQNLLEMKREQLLAQLKDFDEDEVAAEDVTEAVKTSNEPEDEDDSDLDLSSLEGVKCRAPHLNPSGHHSYHDAIVFSCDSIDSTNDVIKVRVVFSHPTQPSMLPCNYFLSGSCSVNSSNASSKACTKILHNFQSCHLRQIKVLQYWFQSCKFSHGEVVPLSSLKEYVEPDFSGLAEGVKVLAKDLSDHLWHHAAIEGVEGDDLIHLRYSHNNKSIHTVPIEMVLPLGGDSDPSSDSEGDQDDPEDDFVPETLLDRIHASGPLGDWEQHTRGIGSKIMMSMGYVMGSGLGKQAEGRVEPVPAMLYPVGRSLDWCMNLREKVGGDGDALSVEKTLKRQQAREEKKAKRRLEAEKNVTSVFDFINKKLGGKRGNFKEFQFEDDSFLRKGKGQGKSSKSDEDKGGSSSSSSRAPDSLNVQNFKVSEEIRRTEKEIEKLRGSFARLKDRDPKSAKSIEVRLKEKLESLRNLRNRENALNVKQSSHNEKKKLTIF